MTPQQARDTFLDKPARTCRCGSPTFRVPPSGGLACTICSPGDAVLTMTAVPGGRKLVWQEFDPDWDGPALDKMRQNRKAELAAEVANDPSNPEYWQTISERFDSRQRESRATSPTTATSQQWPRGITRHAHYPRRIDGEFRVRLRFKVMIVRGLTFDAGREFVASYRYQHTDGVERAHGLLRSDGRIAISQIPMSQVEVIR